MTKTITIDDIAGADIFDLRDAMARVEAIEAELGEAHDDSEEDLVFDLRDELSDLTNLLSEVKGCGGDEQWRGSWYPVTFIRDSYFEEYAEELCKDIGELPREIPHYIVIDWEATANNIRQDYSSVEFKGETYWYR